MQAILFPFKGSPFHTPEALRAAWESGADFKLFGQGCHVSIRDSVILADKFDSVTIVCVYSHVNVKVI
jgi:hypothetical protein